MVICWLNSRHEQTTCYATAQTLDTFPRNFISLNAWSIWSPWTMNTQNLSNFIVFQTFSHKCNNHFHQCCRKELFQFLCDCILNLLKGNLQSRNGHLMSKFHQRVQILSPKRTNWKKWKDVWRPKNGYSSEKLLFLPSLTLCLDMEKYVLVPASPFNKSLNNQSVTKQALPE